MIVKMFKPAFSDAVRSGAKKQTVRPIPKRMPKVGTPISLREWTGAPYRSPQRGLRESTITAVHMIEIRPGSINVDLKPVARDEFAKADGFEDFSRMRDWFTETHGALPFTGILIKWE